MWLCDDGDKTWEGYEWGRCNPKYYHSIQIELEQKNIVWLVRTPKRRQKNKKKRKRGKRALKLIYFKLYIIHLHLGLKPCNISFRSIWVIGSFFELKPRSKKLVPKVSASISSLAVPQARLFLTSYAHWASASPGAWITGIPINSRISLASPAISGVILMLLCDIFLAISISPSSNAFSFFSSAASFNSFLLSNSLHFSLGGVPSKTHIGLTPASRNYIVLWNKPTKCPVKFPSSSHNSYIPVTPTPPPPSFLNVWVAMRN